MLYGRQLEWLDRYEKWLKEPLHTFSCCSAVIEWLGCKSNRRFSNFYSDFWEGVNVISIFAPFPCWRDKLKCSILLSVVRKHNVKGRRTQGGFCWKSRSVPTAFENRHHSSLQCWYERGGFYDTFFYSHLIYFHNKQKLCIIPENMSESTNETKSLRCTRWETFI